MRRKKNEKDETRDEKKKMTIYSKNISKGGKS